MSFSGSFNLAFGTQEGHGSWSLFPTNKKRGTQKGFCDQEPHRVLLGFKLTTSMLFEGGIRQLDFPPTLCFLLPEPLSLKSVSASDKRVAQPCTPVVEPGRWEELLRGFGAQVWLGWSEGCTQGFFNE